MVSKITQKTTGEILTKLGGKMGNGPRDNPLLFGLEPSKGDPDISMELVGLGRGKHLTKFIFFIKKSFFPHKVPFQVFIKPLIKQMSVL